MNRLKCKLRYASAIISDSQYLKKKMVGSGYREKSIHVIHNGVDFGKIRPSYTSQGEKIVLFLAGPYKHKGITHFVRLSEALKPEFPDVRFVWVGQKEVRGKAFEARDYVWNEKELYEIYNSAYLLLLPSLWPEPMSFTVLEAMAHGKPVVAYDIGANSEEIIHGQTGLLAPWGDIKQLQSHVRELLRNEKLARTMGQNARKLIEDRFSLKHMIGNYLGLLEAISESRSK
jgi:glycosyltransferase involved in cell wall biosynthesis